MQTITVTCVTVSLIRFLFCTLILLSLQAYACTNCWVLFNNKCYAFTESFMRWATVRSFCQKFGDDGDMLVIKTLAELSFLKTELRRRKKYYWTGATDEGDEGNWRWIDGSPWDPEIGKRMWYHSSGQPRINSKYNCAYSRPIADWDSMYCTKSTRALCKRSLVVGLSLWTEWGECSKTCGDGNRSRTRKYDNPTPADGGNDCNDNNALMETQFCKLIDCPVNGGLGSWTAWEQCSTTCGDGEKIRTRECNNPAPAYGGDECIADDLTEKMSCKIQECPVNGGPGTWAQWEQCSTTCGDGEKIRTRECSNPAPAYGGDECNATDLTERIYCKVQECPVNGGPGTWTAWEQCSTTCGDGEKIRTRECNNPAPAYGGDECNATDLTEGIYCKVQECPVNGGPGTWTTWEQCSTTCGDGEKIRTRECNNPAPAYGGDECNATDLTEGIYCKVQECPVNGGPGTWTTWEQCSTTCGDGEKIRIRECNYPAPAYGGDECNATDLTERIYCKVQECPGMTINHWKCRFMHVYDLTENIYCKV
ncbi:unnamed protein product [Owenia fusiformis]|uniref:C-type lectin domain-containing protein n=1 Tax=Owenia fusiformis TaxID=6347 RepID=A0A8S4NXY4_OWEFU|nr:unnamed protein product [Owenia fusiformis]